MIIRFWDSPEYRSWPFRIAMERNNDNRLAGQADAHLVERANAGESHFGGLPS
jgi:hypothetical protein